MMVTLNAEEAAAGRDDNLAAVAPRIERRGVEPRGQLLLKCDEPAVIVVEVTGQPVPVVCWHVAGRRVSKSKRYRPAASGRRHTLAVLRVTEEMDKGVWVLASNSAGEDSCLITVKTYKVLSGLPNTFHDSTQNAEQAAATVRTVSRRSTQRFDERRFSGEATSPTTTDWNREMEIRNRMRSVDDLMYYGKWKRESLQTHRDRQRRIHNKIDAGGVSASLDQSYSCSSTTATDDEARLGMTQRRRRTLRLRRRAAGSVVSAPTTRHINLDDSVGSAALDVDSMFRFFATSTPVADNDGLRSHPTMKLEAVLSSGIPPSGAASRTRRVALSRRRSQNSSSVTDIMNASSGTVSSTFNDVQMTSSTVDLQDARTAATIAEDSGVERSRPVRRSVRRRRTSRLPCPTGKQNLTNVTASISASPPNVVKSEALWDLCGEKLNELCRRILNIGVADKDDVVTEVTYLNNCVTDSAHEDVEIVQTSKVVEEPQSRNEAPKSSVSEKQQTKGVFYSVDLTAYRLSPISDVISDWGQPTSQSCNPEDSKEDKCAGVSDVGSSVTGQIDSDDLSRKPTSMTLTDDDVNRREMPVNHVARNDDKLDTEQHQTAESYSPEHCDEQIGPEESTVSDQPLRIDDAVTVHDVEVIAQLNDGSTSSIVEERRALPAVNISAMLVPSIALQDILDTIYQLTSSTDGQTRTTGEDESFMSSVYPTTRDVSGSLTRKDDSRRLLDDVHSAECSASVCLDRADDDVKDEDSLDLDAEMYDYNDLSPAAADLADSVHLAIGEEDDDLDIADYEYDLEDDADVP